MIHSYFYNRNHHLIFNQVDHCRLFLYHGINLDTIALHMQFYQFHNIIYHIHSSYYFSISHHSIRHLDSKISHFHFSAHLTYIRHIYLHSNMLIIHNLLYLWPTNSLTSTIHLIIQELLNYCLINELYLVA